MNVVLRGGDVVIRPSGKQGYIVGAVSREKRIVELEKENAKLKEQNEKMKSILERWYNQRSDKGYTKTFCDELIKATEEFFME